jgi:hypothetical protein
MLDAAMGGRLSGYAMGGYGEWTDWMREYTGDRWDGRLNSLPDVVEGFSGYSLDAGGNFDPPEFLAESFADVEANSRLATPLSQFIHRRMLEAYRAAGFTVNKG